MFKVLHVAAKRHLLRMERKVGAERSERGESGRDCDPNIRWKIFICATGRNLRPRKRTKPVLQRKLISLWGVAHSAGSRGAPTKHLAVPLSPLSVHYVLAPMPAIYAHFLRQICQSTGEGEIRECRGEGNSVWVLAKWTFRANFDFMFATQFMGLWVC